MTEPRRQSTEPQLTVREVAEELIDAATGARGAYYGVPMSRARQWATHRGVDVDELRAALVEVRRERGIG
jgi:hypothetical protein